MVHSYLLYSDNLSSCWDYIRGCIWRGVIIINTIVLTGRLTKDPELKSGQSGKAYARFNLAVNRPMQKDETDFINCVAFGKTAELIGEYLRKGRKVGVVGRLQMGRYEVNGEKRTSYDVIVETLEFLESKNTAKVEETATSEVQEVSSSDDDFPF